MRTHLSLIREEDTTTIRAVVSEFPLMEKSFEVERLGNTGYFIQDKRLADFLQ
ncbi:hypothetical protein [Mesotoga sp.]|uniref:hypothetical protein n=1 Tax=Mesotoga sp. TaxID=2053577 RepID=UPI003562159A